MVPAVGFEPTTPGSEDQCSNPLSYTGAVCSLYFNRDRAINAIDAGVGQPHQNGYLPSADMLRAYLR